MSKRVKKRIEGEDSKALRDDPCGLLTVPRGMSHQEVEDFNEQFKKKSESEQSQVISCMVSKLEESGMPIYRLEDLESVDIIKASLTSNVLRPSTKSTDQ